MGDHGPGLGGAECAVTVDLTCAEEQSPGLRALRHTRPRLDQPPNAPRHISAKPCQASQRQPSRGRRTYSRPDHSSIFESRSLCTLITHVSVT